MDPDTNFNNFYFELSFDGAHAAFQEISGLSREVLSEVVTSGGENRFMYRLPGVATAPNLILRRGLVPKSSRLLAWCAQTIDESFESPLQPSDISIRLLDTGGTVCMCWNVHQAFPIKYHVADLEAEDHYVLLESIEFAYAYYEIIPAGT